MLARQLMRIFPVLLGFVLVAAIACGGAPAAPDPTAPPVAEPTLAEPAAQPTPTPVAEATPMPSPPAAVTPTGILNFGVNPLGGFTAVPKLADATRGDNMGTTAYETLAFRDSEGNLIPRLATEWSLSDDTLVWTFKLQEGVEFHKDYGELTAEDIIYSFNSAGAEESIHARAGQVKNWFRHPEGRVEVVDDYTFQVHTGVPQFGVQTNWQAPTAQGVWIISKKQVDELGEDRVNREAAGTGPWEIVEHRTGEFWRFKAVEDHWRHTPFFAELVLWDIPEEATRMAGFETGALDSMNMALESMPTMERVPGTKFLRSPDAGGVSLYLFGQWYLGMGTPEQRPGYDPDLPWVSADPDPASDEWQRAANVRKALSVSIDREAIVDTLLRGEGSPMWLSTQFLGHENLIYPDVTREYDPEHAKVLLAEAGYPNGFDINLRASPRGIPADVESCEAIATMWDAIGINVRFERLPYETFRPTAVARTYQGGFCQGGPPGDTITQAILGSFRSGALYSSGVDHPWLEDMVETAIATLDDAERERLEGEIGRFAFDNSTHLGVYSADVLFPLGPRIDEWPLAQGIQRRMLHNFELVPPRQ